MTFQEALHEIEEAFEEAQKELAKWKDSETAEGQKQEIFYSGICLGLDKTIKMLKRVRR